MKKSKKKKETFFFLNEINMMLFDSNSSYPITSS